MENKVSNVFTPFDLLLAYDKETHKERERVARGGKAEKGKRKTVNKRRSSKKTYKDVR